MELANYTEYLVAKKADAKTVVIRTLIIVLWCVFVLGTLFGMLASETLRLFIMMLPVLWLLAGFLCWYLLGKTRIEYEYAIVSGYFQLDAIYSKKSRKRLCEAKVSEMQSLLRAKNANTADDAKKIIACSSMKAENAFVFTYRDAKLGNTAVYFDASPKALECFRYYNPQLVSRDMML